MVDNRTKTSWLIISIFVFGTFFALFCESIHLYGFHNYELSVVFSRILNAIVFNIAFVIIISLFNTTTLEENKKLH
jgi:hypothetical protein